MTESEIFEMMYESLSYADRNFEFWISASFAVILAFHFSGNSLSRLMHRLLTFLYLSATILFISRWLVAALQYASFRGQLVALDTAIRISSDAMEILIFIAYILVIGLGTAGTAYFGYKSMQKVDSAGQ